MNDSINHLLGRLAAGEDLSREEMADAIGQVMTGAWSEEQIGLLLTTLAAKGETVAEVAGAASAMRANMTSIRSRHEKLLDTCGTGGGGSTTFNISTSAALVIAAVGVPLAKHGNRSVTSKSGSADVLAELGVNIQADVPQVERCLDELGLCFCFAPLMHPAMKHVGAVRKKLGIRTIFNLLGPLANPAGAAYQLLGVGLPELRPLIASALGMLGTSRALVVSGGDGLGEVSLAGTNRGHPNRQQRRARIQVAAVRLRFTASLTRIDPSHQPQRKRSDSAQRVGRRKRSRSRHRAAQRRSRSVGCWALRNTVGRCFAGGGSD